MSMRSSPPILNWISHFLLVQASFVRQVAARSCSRHSTVGLIGYGLDLHQPACAFACRVILAQARPNSSRPFPVPGHGDGEPELGLVPGPVPTCSAGAFLQSLAWCMHEHCGAAGEAQAGELEWFWAKEVTGTDGESNCSYHQTLTSSDGPPRDVFAPGAVLDVLGSVPHGEWEAAYSAIQGFTSAEIKHSTFCIILFVATVASPMVISSLHAVLSLLSPALERQVLSHVIYPALWGRRHAVPLPFQVGILPSRGEAVLIAVIILSNAVLSAVGYRDELQRADLIKDVSNRAGALACANFAAVVLFSGRNNPLIYITRWSYSTFLLLHRWVAYVSVLQVAVHSVGYFALRLHVGEPVPLYWLLGCMGTVSIILVLPLSVLPVRRRFYELFLDAHVALVMGVLVTSYYHIYCKFGHDRGYENLVVLVLTIWALERFARYARAFIGGLRKATVASFDDDYFEVQIPGAEAAGVAYLYILSVQRWRVWENHPFSVEASVIPRRIRQGGEKAAEEDISADLELVALDPTSDSDPSSPIMTGSDVTSDDVISSASLEDIEDEARYPMLAPAGHLPRADSSATGVRLLVRREGEFTTWLGRQQHCISVLLEASYPPSIDAWKYSTRAAHVVCITGGVGITAALPLIRARAAAGVGRTVLYWGCRSEKLVQASRVEDLTNPALGVEAHIQIGSRLDVVRIVLREAKKGEHDNEDNDVVIFVCGPGSMADDTRWAVVQANRNRRGKGVVRLLDDNYNW